MQFRFSEALTVLPFLMPEAIPGLFVGCIVSNILSPYGLLDLIVGSLATLIAAVATARCRSRCLAPLPPVLSNAAIVPVILMKVYGVPDAWWYLVLTVGAGEIIACGILGLLLWRSLKNVPQVRNMK